HHSWVRRSVACCWRPACSRPVAVRPPVWHRSLTGPCLPARLYLGLFLRPAPASGRPWSRTVPSVGQRRVASLFVRRLFLPVFSPRLPAFSLSVGRGLAVLHYFGSSPRPGPAGHCFWPAS